MKVQKIYTNGDMLYLCDKKYISKTMYDILKSYKFGGSGLESKSGLKSKPVKTVPPTLEEKISESIENFKNTDEQYEYLVSIDRKVSFRISDSWLTFLKNMPQVENYKTFEELCLEKVELELQWLVEDTNNNIELEAGSYHCMYFNEDSVSTEKVKNLKTDINKLHNDIKMILPQEVQVPEKDYFNFILEYP